MELRSLRYFLAVVHSGSLNKAASDLRLSQPALSRAIAALEREMGFPLFHRRARGVTLTESGERIVGLAKRVVADADELIRESVDLRTSVGGRVFAGLTVSLTEAIYTATLSAVVESAPGIRVTSQGFYSPEAAISGVLDGTLDLAIVGHRIDPRAPGIRTEALYSESIVVAVPRDSVLVAHAALPVELLEGQPFIADPPGSEMRTILDEYVESRGARIVTEVSFRQAVLPMVARGTGLALLPAGLLKLTGRTDIVAIPLALEEQIPIWLVTRPQATASAALFASAARASAGRIHRSHRGDSS